MTVIDLRIFRRVADAPKNGRLTSVGPPDNKNPEMAELLSEVFEMTCIFCRHAGVSMRGKK